MEIVCVDVETTGLDSATDEILEVCAIKFDEIGQIKDRFYRLCEPISGFIPAEATAIHGITMPKVQGKPPYMDVREELAKFIGKAKVIGHNIIAFDLKFLKLEPAEVEDTLLMCRAKWPGGNKLEKACERVGVKFDPKKAHGAGYDVERNIELYLTLTAMAKKDEQQDLFSPGSKDLPATQAYSYSRISLFQQCPWKWYRVYVMKQKERSTPLVVGSCIHLVAQLSAMWCYSQSFARRFKIYAEKKNLKFNDAVGNAMREAVAGRAFYLPTHVDAVTTSDIGAFLYMNMGYCQSFFGIPMSDMINAVTAEVSVTEFEKCERPPYNTYRELVQKAIAMTRITDTDALNDIEFLSEFFYHQKDFLVIDGTIAMVEKKLSFSKDWQLLPDFFSSQSFFRGVLDIIEYNSSEMVTITDYKSGRRMMTEAQLRNDRQLLVYVMLVHLLLPQISTIRIRHHYIRFGKTVEVDITNVSEVADEARAWAIASINEIETALQQGQKAFEPCRNEFCGSCSYMESSECPLFNIKHINDINNPSEFVIKTIEDVQKAWKKIEVCKAESRALTAKCKAFINAHHVPVTIDGKAKLDFWTKVGVEYDVEETTKMLVEKKVPLLSFLKYLSLTKTGWEKIQKMLAKTKVEVTETELAKVSSPTRKVEFEALTEEEAAEDYANVIIRQPAESESTGSTKA